MAPADEKLLSELWSVGMKVPALVRKVAGRVPLRFTYGKLDGAEQSSYMLLLERCDCDLGSLIYPKAGSEEEGQLSAPLMMKIATEMADGLAYLHSRGIKHLDMKPGNVLMVNELGSQGWSVRIADFGMEADKEDDDEVYGTWECVITAPVLHLWLC